MSLGYNSAMPNSGASLEDLERAIGIPKFGGAAGENWTLILNGMIIQGGKITFASGATTTAYPFNDPFTLQVLGVFIQCTDKHAVGVPSTTLSTFTVDHDGTAHDAFWWAIGV